MDPIVLMAFANIRPISEINFTVASVNEFDPSKPWVGRFKIVLSVVGDIRIAFAVNGVGVNSSSMKICGKKLVVKFFRPLVALIDHQPSVSMATTSLVGAIRNLLVASGCPMFFADVPVKVISCLVNQLVKMRIEMGSVHALITRVWDDVK